MEKSNAAVFIHKVAGVYVNRGEGGRGGDGGGGQGGDKEHEKDLSEHLFFLLLSHLLIPMGSRRTKMKCFREL